MGSNTRRLGFVFSFVLAVACSDVPGPATGKSQQRLGIPVPKLLACTSSAPCTMPLIATGGYYSLARRHDGTLWAWGQNSSGQFGDGTQLNAPVPKDTGIAEETLQVVGGDGHTLTLRNDGTVWAFGKNLSGQVGDGFTFNLNAPVAVVGLPSSVVAISAGRESSYAITEDGALWSWGNNAGGQLGDGTTQNRPTATEVFTDVVAISGGGFHVLALRSDKTVWAFGSNAYGQLGDGTTDSRTTPVAVANLTDVIAIGTGYDHSLAVTSDGALWTWGANFYGQLGQGTVGAAANLTTPTPVSGVPPMMAVTAGIDHSIALAQDGTVWAWGANSDGQLGDGNTSQQTTPVMAVGLTDVVAVRSGDLHTIALKSDFSIWAWGANFFNQLGDNTSLTRQSPVDIGFSWAANACATLPSCMETSCSDSVCSGYGACNAGTCACDQGYDGTTCGTCAANHYNFPTCTFCEAATTCNGNGTCDSMGACVCSTGYSGVNCEVAPLPPDAGQPDGGETDAGAPDSGEQDAGESDAGESDAGEPDAGAMDGGNDSDAGDGETPPPGAVTSGCGCQSTDAFGLPMTFLALSALRLRRRRK